MKACKKCGALKNEQDFYAKHSACKECTKARVRANRATKADCYREYDRRRASQKKRVEARAAYAKTAEGRARTRRAKEAWAERNKHKRAAHSKVSNALRNGKLLRQSCEVCGATKSVEAHHDDYNRPLDVRWLCTKHHAEHHARARELLRKAS